MKSITKRLWLVLLAWVLTAPVAFAGTCKLTSNGGQPLKANINLSSITAATAGTAGTVLATRDIPLSTLSYTCGDNVNTELRMTMAAGAAQTAVDNVYTTSVNGLGIRIRWPSATWWPNALRCRTSGSNSCSVSADSVRVELVQTGPIKASTLPIGTYGTVTLLAPDDSSAGQVVAMQVIVSAPINVLVNTCAITSDTRVDVGAFTDTTFDTKTTGPKVPFNLTLNCPSASVVGITFDGDAPFGNAVSGLVANQGSAKNIAVQLLDSNGTMGVKLGKKNSLGTVTGAKTLNYNARVYRTGTQSVTAGDIDAFVVFTLDVQ
ncbi:fimbrial protein [Cupriavidus pauculus]|jgi:hypothetical protein|uniref:fimbrial protein n=1 Tax=Cupriavidus pauculus TaxID=82633 RepID=UPI003857A27A